MGTIFYTTSDFKPSELNPFNENKPYDKEWVMVKLLEEADYFLFTGRGTGNLFQVIITKKLEDWQYRIMDFIEYEKSHNMNIIIAIDPEDLRDAQEEYKGHHFKEPFLRDFEEKVLVHSTTWESWQSIQTDQCLKSWNFLNRGNSHREEQPIGEVLGDPLSYRNYIMFTNGGVTGEIVVLSKQRGKIVMNTDLPYQPGARLYFDAEKIAQDGLLVRDGAHLKVENLLPLEKYLIWWATSETLGLREQEVTPLQFTEKADGAFQEKHDMKLS